MRSARSARLCEVCVLPRFHVGDLLALVPGVVCALPEGVSRHVQVLRMQPGGQLQLFDGLGLECLATVTEMGRKVVSVEVGPALAVDRELPVRVTLAMGMPANDRMDALVEKAAELGVWAIQPLVCERSVLRLDGDRAAKKVAHWQAVAVSACEQSGRAVVPVVRPVKALGAWLRGDGPAVGAAAGHEAPLRRAVLSLRDGVTLSAWLRLADEAGAGTAHSAGAPGTQAAGACATAASSRSDCVFLSGPEGGLSPAEEQLALDLGWQAVSLGKRVLRADTAPLAALSVMGAHHEG